MEIPKDKIDVNDPQVRSFLEELCDMAVKTHGEVKTLLEHWDDFQEMKRKDPRYWHINK